MAALRSGMAGPEIDMAGALAMAVAMGAAPRVAAPLLAAFAAGLAAGRMKRAEGGDDPGDRG